MSKIKSTSIQELDSYRVIVTACIKILSEYGSAYMNHELCANLEKYSVKKLVNFVDNRFLDIKKYQSRKGVNLSEIKKYDDYVDSQSYFLTEVLPIVSVLAMDDKIREDFINDLVELVSKTNVKYINKLENCKTEILCQK